MSKTEQTGGIGKSPAIEKVNRIEHRMMQQVEYIKKLAFGEGEVPGKMKRILKIVDNYQISFETKEDRSNE